MLRLCAVNCLLSTLCQQSCCAMCFAALLCVSAECLSITGLSCSHTIGISLFAALPPAGWFCVSAAWNSQPFDLDNYTNANCLCPATSTGGRCQVGFYCPLGSPEPLLCPPGSFCNMSGIWKLINKS